MRKFTPDMLIILLLFLLPLAFFAPVTLGGKTLLPVDNLYQWEPFSTYTDVVQAPDVPHNALVSDLILQNVVWKQFINDSVRGGELPLWNPNAFGGIPFFAAGQSSALYPLSFLHMILPLDMSYGWYAAIQLWMAGIFMYWLGRGLDQRRIGALVAAISWQLSAFFLVRSVFPMIQSAAAWLPLLLLMVEFTIQSKPLFGRPATLPWVFIGAVSLGLVVYAGHVEILYYTLLVMGLYAAVRLISGWWAARSKQGTLSRVIWRGVWLLMLVAFGMALGAGQFLPMLELVEHNFREGSASLGEIRGWAYPLRRIIAFVMPNFYGNPTHHQVFDVFTFKSVPVTVNALGDAINHTDWGIKNYVEGGAYMGILPMVLAVFALISAWGDKTVRSVLPKGKPCRGFFAGLGVMSLTFIFGTPTYALLYYLLPGINQLHSPFRWVFPLTMSVSVLAGFGADALADVWENRQQQKSTPSRTASYAGWGGNLLLVASGVTLGGLLFSRIFYAQVEPLVDRVLHTLAKAEYAFADAASFYSYQFVNVLILGLVLLGAGMVFKLVQSPRQIRQVSLWQPLTVIVIVLDLMVATMGFNPASDPALLDFTPPSMAWLQSQQDETDPFRVTTYDVPGVNTANANIPMLFGLQDVRGYDSIIPKQFTDYMALISPQFQLDYNRVAPLTTDQPYALESPLLAALGVRFVITETTIESPLYTLAYEDEAVRIYENESVLPRAYTLPLSSTVYYNDFEKFAALVQNVDPRTVVMVNDPNNPFVSENPPLSTRYADVPEDCNTCGLDEIVPGIPEAQPITQYGNIQVMVDATIDDVSWLVLNDSYFDGWRAYVRPFGASEDYEWQLPIELVNGNFRGVLLEPEILNDHYVESAANGDVTLSDSWTVRFRYSPQRFQVGAFISFMAFMIMVFAAATYLWRTFYGRPVADGQDDQDGAELQRVAKNSAVPIIMNLFNKGIDFAFAFIMLRILGPEGAGIYYYAIVVFGWFDIFTNFGLNTFLTREVARDRSQARRYLFNTSALRIGFAVLGIPLLLVFIYTRQTTITPPLDGTAIAAIVLLYLGLLPNSLSTGLSALFYAFEQAEYPAAVATIGTISKAMIGLGALLLGYGVVGLAGVSIITNCIILGVLLLLSRPLLRNTRQDESTATKPTRVDGRLMRHMILESWPLMINHLLATIFYKIDIILIEAISGVRTVGWYSTAYKWLDALQVIPAFLSAALFPVMSRQAQDDPAALVRSYRLSVKLLYLVALPVAITTTFIAPALILTLGGTEFLPDGAIALQLMVWSIPFGWVNSVTQYMLIALNRQRILTWAFGIAVTFNIIANLIFLPRYSYRAAAVITIMSEGLLLSMFTLVLVNALRDRIPDDPPARSISFIYMLWRPTAVGFVMLGVFLVLWDRSAVLALGVAGVVYGVGLLVLPPFDAEERVSLLPILPGPIRSRLEQRLNPHG